MIYWYWQIAIVASPLWCFIINAHSLTFAQTKCPGSFHMHTNSRDLSYKIIQHQEMYYIRNIWIHDHQWKRRFRMPWGHTASDLLRLSMHCILSSKNCLLEVCSELCPKWKLIDSMPDIFSLNYWLQTSNIFITINQINFLELLAPSRMARGTTL